MSETTEVFQTSQKGYQKIILVLLNPVHHVNEMTNV